jgi:hypothetical protein
MLKYPVSHLTMPKLTKAKLEKLVDWDAGSEFMRSRLIYKSLDAVLTAPLRPQQGRPGYLKTILNINSSNYERVAAGTNLVNSFVPGFARQVSSSLCDTSRFPLAEADIQLMSYGSGSTVFLIKMLDRDWVLKIYRRSLGKKGSSLDQIANHFKEKYETVSSWYNGRFNLVPPAHFLILYGPIFSSPAAAVLQPFIHGRKSDLFLDYSNANLLELMKNDQKLADRVLYFIERTLHIYNQHNLCIDFLGRENLMLVEENGRHKLLIIDNGIFNLNALYLNARDVWKQMTIRMERLANIEALFI